MKKAQMIRAMVDFYRGNTHDIEHFLKVYSYASAIGRLEGLDERTQSVLEMTAIVHDISCPLCREKYRNTNGKHQERESEDILRPFLAPFGLPELAAAAVVVLMQIWKRNAVLSILAGTIAYMVMIQMLL